MIVCASVNGGGEVGDGKLNFRSLPSIVTVPMTEKE